MPRLYTIIVGWEKYAQQRSMRNVDLVQQMDTGYELILARTGSS